jgi:transcriptional regulator with GAF, ATPase, and Fis domain
MLVRVNLPRHIEPLGACTMGVEFPSQWQWIDASESLSPAAATWICQLLRQLGTKQGPLGRQEELLRSVVDALGGTWAALLELGPEVRVLQKVAEPETDSLARLRGPLQEALDRQAVGIGLAPSNGQAFLVMPFSRPMPPNTVLGARLGRGSSGELLTTAAGLAWIRPTLSVLFHDAAQLRTLEQQVLDLRSLLEHTRRLAAIEGVEPLLEAIAQSATELLEADRASIFIWDRKRREVVGRPALGVPGGSLRLPDHYGIVGAVLRSGRAAMVNDTSQDPRFRPDVDQKSGYRTRSVLAVPLTDPKGATLGVFEVLNKLRGSFTVRDQWLLERLAEQVAVVLPKAREREHLGRVAEQWAEQVEASAQIVGVSSAIRELKATIKRLAQTELPVLILGESGTGKEVVARAIHWSSHRARNPFIAVNCAAIAETLMESELFGHERGAFTDARESRPGRFELAQGGTLFLDEIGDLSLAGQAKLLRVLEEKIVYRVGGTVPIPVDVRIVAASNRDLTEAVRQGKFREDLYYRLSVVTVHLAPLRRRKEDILPLAEHFLRRFCADAGRPTLVLREEAKQILLEHDWPGNVRELKNLMERLAFLAPSDELTGNDIRQALVVSPTRRTGMEPTAGLTLSQATEEFQRRYILEAIRKARGNLAEAGRLLGLHRSNFYRKLRRLGIDPKQL